MLERGWTPDVKAFAVRLVVLTLPAVVTPRAYAEEADREAVLKFYHRLRKAEPEAERSMWSEDTRWLNAFGRVLVGRDAIMDWEAHLQAEAGYAASHVSRQDDPEIKFLCPDVAIIHEYHEREGQIIDGVVTPTRRINTSYVLTMEKMSSERRTRSA